VPIPIHAGMAAIQIHAEIVIQIHAAIQVCAEMGHIDVVDSFREDEPISVEEAQFEKYIANSQYVRLGRRLKRSILT
jgi:hypothetical protein